MPENALTRTAKRFGAWLAVELYKLQRWLEIRSQSDVRMLGRSLVEARDSALVIAVDESAHSFLVLAKAIPARIALNPDPPEPPGTLVTRGFLLSPAQAMDLRDWLQNACGGFD